MNDINDIISIEIVNMNFLSVPYIDFHSDREIDQSKIDALERKKKIQILNEKDTTETKKDIDSELEQHTGIATMSPKVVTKSISLVPRNLNKIDEVEIINKIKSLGDISRNESLNEFQSYIFDIVKSSLDDKKLIQKIFQSSYRIAHFGRIGAANFILVNSSLYEQYIDAFQPTLLKDIKLFVTDHIAVDEIVLGRKSSSGNPGLRYFQNEINKSNITYCLSDIGFYPQRQFMTIKIN